VLDFGAPFNLGSSVNTDIVEESPSVIADGLSLLFHRNEGPPFSPNEIYEATRTSTDLPFANLVSAGTEVNSQVHAAHPTVSLDGLTLLYDDDDGSGLYQSTRLQRDQPFGGVTSIGDLLPGQPAYQPSLSADGLTLFFTAWDTDNLQNDIYQATRPTMNDPWGNVIMLGSAINVPGYNDAMPSISLDGLRLFFNSNRPGGFGQFDLYVATRPSTEAPWEAAVNVGPQVNTAYDDKGPCISPDGGLLYFHSNRPGGFGLDDLYAVTVGYDSPAAPTITISDATATEGSGSGALLIVTLSSASPSTVTVDYATQSDSALAGGDFVASAGTLTFAPGQISQTIPVQTVNDPTIELNETFNIVLSNSTVAVLADNKGVATIIDDDTKFYIVDDATANQIYEYGSGTGTPGESYSVAAGNTAPRGAASTAAGDKVWVVDANKNVYVYNASGGLLGSWTVGGLNAQAQVEGIATNGTDIWIVDAKQDKVFRYTNAASRLSGSQNAASSFALNNGNKNPKDLVTDGASMWVVDDASTDKVFKYTLAGSLVGSWPISGGGGSPTGITLDPSAPAHLWIVDTATDRVYQFDNAVGRTSGSQGASMSFALATGNTNPQGIADPPVQSALNSTTLPIAGVRTTLPSAKIAHAATLERTSHFTPHWLPVGDYDFAPIVVSTHHRKGSHS